ncbi:hypothetical protein VSS74_01325 [Conexibacter stalactiti]|uniref:Mce-associated membrane protein n=1 Tax=Conexibacter stalactiti TaxID=1940611 RepID=A0ABU4HI24_9ACTN|nr:hypothetical protein [Conexibacter stalactiti]MDW5592958.1 hypothetical protein [Conexibacter stalactiti]MEC5033599.1 hypothetical protein [Conexibacter stalactiti]
MNARLPILILVALLAAAGVGCGASDPYLDETPMTETIVGDPRQPPPERVGPRPDVDDDIADAEPTPEAALRRYADLSINWTADTLADNQRALARISIGGARQTAFLAAERIDRDDTLRRSRVSSTGSVLSAAPGSASARGSWVVVTREQMVGRDAYRGLPATYHVTIAKLERRSVGWVVSSWAPQS